MNYPIWELTTIGGPTLIAIIAVIHVYLAHLAVGGGMFIWLTDRKAWKENSTEIHDYVKSHTNFFLLLTMVFGGVTGVGIWFVIALVNPAGTSSLIHNFVFGWAIEWVFFLGEIVSLLLYHYYFDKLSKKGRQTLSFFYFLFAWLSLFIINGILSFMLTPGTWLEDGNFWSGFFNPTFFPSLVFRTFLTIMVAGLFGYVTIVFKKDSEFRTKMLRYSSKWMLLALIASAVFAFVYYWAVPEHIVKTNFGLNPQMAPLISKLLYSGVAIAILGIFFLLRISRALQQVLVFVLVIIGLSLFGAFEYIREVARKPYVIGEYMYSNGILKSEIDQVRQDGFLKHAKWIQYKEINDENKLEVGKEIFRAQCLSCHTINGWRNDIVDRTDFYTYTGMVAELNGMGTTLDYMPPFAGNQEEINAVAAYIISALQNKELIEFPEPYEQHTLDTKIADFDSEKDEYVLLAWNDLGMHCISDSDPWFVILPPANGLEAVLIKRGEVPQIITEGVEIIYTPEEGFENPSNHVRFWEYSEKLFGAKLDKTMGLFGHGINGKLELNESKNAYVAHGIPAVPYNDNGTYNPYPYFKIEAKDKDGNLLASTYVVAPTSTEMGCRNCHGGPWRVDGQSGVSDVTAMNILASHDRINGTTLLKDAEKGNPLLCASCHRDPATKSDGKPGIRSLSASLHGWHANYMQHYEGAKACVMCHPSSPDGNTLCMRGVHASIGLECTNCHGEIALHATALLKGEEDKASTKHLLKNLKANISYADVKARSPWVNQPNCTKCHVDFQAPDDWEASINNWEMDFSKLFRQTTDNAGLRCEACHGSPHALYPATNIYGNSRDNSQPLQYMSNSTPIGSDMKCETCHTKKMDTEMHHEHSLRPFRNRDLIQEK